MDSSKNKMKTKRTDLDLCNEKKSTFKKAKSNHKLLKKKNIIVFCTIIIIVLVIIGVMSERKNSIKPELLYCQEYVVGTGNIKGDVDIDSFIDISDKFAIGANSYGYAVFKDPEAAFIELKKIYALGIEVIKKEFGLRNLSQKNYKLYGTYGWQVTSGTDEEIAQASFVSRFIDIYENSFVEY